MEKNTPLPALLGALVTAARQFPDLKIRWSSSHLQRSGHCNMSVWTVQYSGGFVGDPRVGKNPSRCTLRSCLPSLSLETVLAHRFKPFLVVSIAPPFRCVTAQRGSDVANLLLLLPTLDRLYDLTITLAV